MWSLRFYTLVGTYMGAELPSPSRVLVELRTKVSSFSNVSPTSSQAAAKLGCRTFWIWSDTVTSRSSSWQARSQSQISVLAEQGKAEGANHVLPCVRILVGPKQNYALMVIISLVWKI